MTAPKRKVPGYFLIRAIIRIFLLIVVTFILFFPVLFTYLLKWEWWRALLVRFFYGSMRYICGIRLKVEGDVSKLRPLMLVANHSSYLDIFVLGGLVPLSFTPKKEIRSWPIIGFCCVLADCIFIERKAADMQRVQAEMAKRLSTGKVIGLFPEGTTGDGYNLKKFKSGFLSLAENFDLPLQPVSIAYTHIGNTPLNAENRSLVAWIDDATLVGHLMRLMSFSCIRVTVTVHDVEKMSDFADRKELAAKAEEVIRTGLAKTLAENGVTG